MNPPPIEDRDFMRGCVVGLSVVACFWIALIGAVSWWCA